jgi:hypothetical protein
MVTKITRTHLSHLLFLKRKSCAKKKTISKKTLDESKKTARVNKSCIYSFARIMQIKCVYHCTMDHFGIFVSCFLNITESKVLEFYKIN